jgi:predicted permease
MLSSCHIDIRLFICEYIYLAIVLAIIPVFLIIFSGLVCAHYQFVSAEFWRGAEKVTYFLLFPALLISKIAVADLAGLDILNAAIVIILLYAVLTLLLVVLQRFVKFSPFKFTSVYQGGIRFNTYIGLSLVIALFGPEGLVMAIMLITLMIPALNFLCVLVLELYNQQGDSKGKIFKRVSKSIINNPLILSCMAGVLINVLLIPVPLVLLETLDIFSKATLPLGLLTVGAALNLRSISTSIAPLLVASVAKFLVLPVIAMVLCSLFNIEPLMRNVLLLLTLLPTASAAYMLARQLGGDYELMATIITVQTVLAGIMMPIMLIIFV